jgi:L-rhamnose mutarotase
MQSLKLISIFVLSLLVLSTYTKANEKLIEVKMGQEKVTKRVGSLIKVRPEFEERYIILHKNAFPGVLSRIKESNIRNYSIFLLDGILFSYYEYIGADYDADMKAIADPSTRDWWKLTDPMQEPLSTRKEGEWWAAMDQALCLDKLIKPSPEAQRVAVVAQIIQGKDNDVISLIKNSPSGMEGIMNKHNIQNCNMYVKDSKLYFYFEYDGNDLLNDLGELMRDDNFKAFQDGLQNMLIQKDNQYWQFMKEVFHTN